MRKKLVFGLAIGVIAALVACPVAMADTYKTSNATYEYEVSGSKALVTQAKSSASTIKVPQKLNGKKVHTIYYNAFYNCKNLKKVTLPKTLKKLAAMDAAGIANPFANCKKLKTIKLAKGNKSFVVKNKVLMNKKKNALAVYPAGLTRTTYTIPKTVKVLGNGCFENSKLTKIKGGKNVLYIKNAAFACCNKLTVLTIPSKVKTFGAWVFRDSKKLKAITVTTKRLGEYDLTEFTLMYSKIKKIIVNVGTHEQNLTYAEKYKNYYEAELEDKSNAVKFVAA